MHLCSLDLKMLYASLKNSFLRNFPRDAQLQKFSHTNGISCRIKKRLPTGFQTGKKKRCEQGILAFDTGFKWPKSKHGRAGMLFAHGMELNQLFKSCQEKAGQKNKKTGHHQQMSHTSFDSHFKKHRKHQQKH
jgi:hypothetical protein